jgi:hypothetical protein
MLNAADIIAEAEASIGFTDPERHLRINLDHLVNAINAEADLAPASEGVTRHGLVERTADRLAGLKFLHEHPEIGDEVITNPVFLTGLPRSGTTYFHYLFDRDPRFRLIRTWEAVMPSPPPGFAPETVATRMAQERERNAALSAHVAGFDAMHLIDDNGPQECHVFLEQSYAAAGFFNLLNVPSYFDYVMNEADLAGAYRVHKRQLQLLQWRLPRPRWALKYPNHVIATDAIIAVHPEARFVMTHRDPVQTVASITKFTMMLRAARSNTPPDPHLVGRQMLDFVRRHTDRIMAFTAGPNSDRVTHIDYYRLVDNPAAEMAKAHAQLGIGTPEDVRAGIDDWHRQNPKNARGANPYALETYGLNADAVAELFSDYTQRFDIPREAEGLARA